MLKFPAVWALGLLGLGSLGLAVAAYIQITDAEGQPNLTASQYELLKVKWTVASAFLGFFFATGIKFCFDTVLEEQKARRARDALAQELLAEMRYVSTEVPRFFEKVRYLGQFTSIMGMGDLDLKQKIRTYVSTLPAPHTPVYQASIGELGQLGGDIAARTVRVYAGIQALHSVKSAILAAEMTSSAESFAQVLNFVNEMETALTPEIKKLLSHLARTTEALD